MGYSYSAKAGYVLDELIVQLQATNQKPDGGNDYYSGSAHYFYEHGREQADGAITGTVWKYTGEKYCKRSGTFRIEPNGKISRFTGSNKNQRESAQIAGLLKFYNTHGGSWTNDEVLPEHLRTAPFIAV